MHKWNKTNFAKLEHPETNSVCLWCVVSKANKKQTNDGIHMKLLRLSGGAGMFYSWQIDLLPVELVICRQHTPGSDLVIQGSGHYCLGVPGTYATHMQHNFSQHLQGAHTTTGQRLDGAGGAVVAKLQNVKWTYQPKQHIDIL